MSGKYSMEADDLRRFTSVEDALAAPPVYEPPTPREDEPDADPR